MKVAVLFALTLLFVFNSLAQPSDDSLNVTRVGRFNVPNNPYGLLKDDSFLYLTDEGNHFYVLNYSRLDSLTIVGQCSLPASPNYGMAKYQQYIFVTMGMQGLAVINSTNPTQPQVVYTLAGISSSQDIAIVGSFAYVAAWDAVYVVRLSPLDSLQVIGSFTTPGDAVGVKVVGNRLYIADRYGGFRIYDCTNPYSLLLLGDNDAQHTAYSIDVQGNYAYLAGGSNSGFTIYNIANPSNIIHMGQYTFGGGGMFVDVEGEFAYLAGYATGVQIVNIANPAFAFRSGYYDPVGSIWRVNAWNPFCFALGNNELSVFNCSPALPVIERDPYDANGTKPVEFVLLQSYPNPFNRSTTITYTLPRAASVELSVYDAQGRRVKTWIQGLSQEPGTYSISLNGVGLSSGIYYIQLNADHFTQTRKMIYLK